MAPQILSTSRPDISSKKDFDGYINASLSFFTPRSLWRRLCPGGVFHESADCPSAPAAELEWIPARFGHTAAAISATRILFYGGYLCKTRDDITGVCTEVILGNDLWEFDSVQARNGLKPFRQLGLDPSMRGVIGQAALTVPLGSGANHQILIFGGAPEMYFVFALGQQQPPTAIGDEGEMELRQILYRVNKVRNSSTSGLGCLSFHSAVRTDTSGILFGGYSRNSLTSAVYSHDLNFRAPSTALNLISPVAETPSARGYPGLAKATASSLVMFGGTVLESNTSVCVDGQCCGSTRGVWDIWSLDVSRQSWSKIVSTKEPTLLSFGGVSSFFIDGILAINIVGGVLCGYKSGVTFTDQFSDCLLSGICNHHPSSDIQLVAVQSSVSTCLLSRRTLTDPVPEARCMQALQFGSFVEQSNAIVMYGGLNGFGQALSDMWYYNVDGAVLLMKVPVVLTQVTKFPLNISLFLSIIQRVPGCDAESIGKSGIISIESVVGTMIKLSIELLMPDFEGCLGPLAMVPMLFAQLSAGTDMSEVKAAVNLLATDSEITIRSTQYYSAIPDTCSQQEPGIFKFLLRHSTLCETLKPLSFCTCSSFDCESANL